MPQQSASWDARPSAQEQGFAQLCAGAAFGVALLATAGGLFHLQFLAGQREGHIPMSPSTALAFLLLSSGVFGHARWSSSVHRLNRRVALAAAGLPALLGLLILAQFFIGFDSRVEWMLSRTNELAGAIPLGRMSPLTAGALLLESAALMLLLHTTQWRFAASGAALFALLGTAGGLVVSVGYAYGAPLLYGGANIPVAQSTALAFVLLGMGEIALALRGVPVLRAWSGDSTRGMLVRAFLPAMLLFVLIEDWLAAAAAASLNPALLHSMTALVTCVLIVAITGWTARRVGDALERAGETLRSSEERFRRMFRHSAAGMVLVSPDFGFLQVNDAFCKMLGYTESELVGKTFQDVTIPEDRPVGGGVARRILAGETELLQFEKRYLHKDGTVVWGLVVSTLIRDTQDRPLHFVTQIQDITDRKRAEEELRASEERSRMLARALQCADECISITDLEDRILYVNEAFCRTYGYRGDELIGRHISVLRSERTSKEIHDEILPATMAGQWHGELWNRTKDGREFPISLNTSVVYDEGGQMVALVGIARDITERKRAEEERTTLQAQLHQAQKMESIGRLAGGVAHDFNNLLTVINGYSQLLLDDRRLDETNHRTLTEILKAGDRAARLTAQLLAYSRKQVLKLRPLNLNDVVGEMRTMLQRLVGEDVEVSVALKASNGVVQADPHQLGQVVMNLAVNAKHAMPGGGKLMIETANVELDENDLETHPGVPVGRYVMLVVSDTGVGMDKETQLNIFEPFFTTKGMGKGTGLGLSTVQGIVAQSNGYIDVHSELGQGTTFRIYLPLLTEVAVDEGRPEATVALGGKETVLLVEDEPGVRQFAVAALEFYGYRVLQTQSRDDALAIFEQEGGRIHLVLTDVVMPNGSGKELADELERRQFGGKVLFMSGYTDDAIAHHGVLESAAEFIQKPFSPEQLATKVRMVLGK